MKFRAVWEDSDTGDEAEVEDSSLLDILPRKVDKGKGRQIPTNEDLEDDHGSFGEGQNIELKDHAYAVEITPMQERRSARALVPTENGDYVHPHEAEHSTRRSTPTAAGHTRVGRAASMEVEEATPPPVPWPAKLGIEPHRVHVMQQSFFHTHDPRANKEHTETNLKPCTFPLANGKKRPREPSMQALETQQVSAEH
jgi:nuclear pore complex protein Nup98-Nup96